MEINLLVLNVGNSRLAIGVFEAGKLTLVKRIPHAERNNWQEAIAGAWERIGDKVDAAVAGACVNPPLLEGLEMVVQKVAEEKILWVGADLDLPIKTHDKFPGGEFPRGVGMDRLLNVAAAYEQMGKACAVVDAGTAITVDCCNDDGEFLGGAIGPGLAMMLDSLHEKTAQLPRVSFEIPTGVFGRDTTQAIRQGVYHGIRGMVRELVENYATELGQWPELIATGGDAAALFTGWDLVHAVAPDLTLYGIALAYAEHHLKRET
jgi:type III pantothenate kinase